MSVEEIRNYVGHVIVELAGDGTLEPAPDDDLLALGCFDSLFVQELVVQLEKHYGVAIPEDDVLERNFESVNSLAQYIEGRIS